MRVDQVSPGTSIAGRAAVFLEDGVAGDDAFQTVRVGAIDHRDERVIVHVAKRGIEREIGIETGQRLRREERRPRVSSPLPSGKGAGVARG